MQRHHDSSEALCRYVAERSDCVLLSFSLGKDAIGSWLQLREYFARIMPFYLEIVPGLEFVERELRWYEEYFRAPIIRLPHPALYRMLGNLVFQPPERCAIIEESGLAIPGYDQLADELRAELGLEQDTLVASGVRASDSIVRRTSIATHGVLNPARRQFFPIFDWSAARLRERIRQSGAGLPIDYELFGRSFDGIDFRFLEPISRRFPDDYRRIIEIFPLAELELLRHTWREAHDNESE